VRRMEPDLVESFRPKRELLRLASDFVGEDEALLHSYTFGCNASVFKRVTWIMVEMSDLGIYTAPRNSARFGYLGRLVIRAIRDSNNPDKQIGTTQDLGLDRTAGQNSALSCWRWWHKLCAENAKSTVEKVSRPRILQFYPF
jgi:hypothetical protein